MGQKFVILPDPMQVSEYVLTVVGLPPLTPTSVGSLAKELDQVELPDRTQVSGFRSKPGEFEMKIPYHHLVEVAAMSLWHTQGEVGDPTYKKVGTMKYQSGGRLNFKLVTIVGLWCCNIVTPDTEMGNDGEMVEATYTMKYDTLLGI